MGIDFGQLRQAIKDSARQAFDVARYAHPGESFCSFALYSDDGADTIWPSANTEEGYERRMREWQENESFMKEIASKGVAFAKYRVLFRWSISEWASVNEGQEHFSNVKALLRAGHATAEEDSDGFEGYQGRVFASMLLGMRDLDAEGYFGTEEDRLRVTLWSSLVDSSSAAWLEEASARLLNPSVVYQSFWGQWSQSAPRAEDFHRHRTRPSNIYQAFMRQIEASN